MRQASEHLTPVTLELGGKSPCIVEKSANLRLAAKRIVFGKFLNCGQTCVAPDYIYCERTVKDRLVKEIQKQLQRQYGKEPLKKADYGKIINEKHFDRIVGLIEQKKVVSGGKADRRALTVEPTVIDNVTFGDAVMQEEIFGPLLPVLTFDTLDEAVRNIQSMPHPLALYIFSNNRQAVRKVTSQCGFGADASMIRLSILLRVKWASAGSVRAAWELIMGRMGSGHFHMKKVLWTRRRGSICLCAISLIEGYMHR